MKTPLQSTLQNAQLSRSFRESGNMLRGNLWSLVKAVLAKEPEELRVLDVGCGTGQTISDLVKVLSSRVARVSGVGVDVNPLSGGGGLIELKKGAAEKLELEDDSIDFGYSVQTLQYLDDPLEAIKEAHRVIKPGGVFLWDYYNPTIPFVGESFKSICDNSPEMRDSITIINKLIIDRVPLDKPDSKLLTPYRRVFSVKHGRSKMGYQGKCTEYFTAASYEKEGVCRQEEFEAVENPFLLAGLDEERTVKNFAGWDRELVDHDRHFINFRHFLAALR